MATYSVLGLDRHDREVTLLVPGETDSSAREEANRRGVQAISVTRVNEQDTGPRVKRRIGKLSDKQVWHFCERLAPMQEQNIPAGKSMEFISGSAPDPEIRALAIDIKEKLGNSSLVEAICATNKFPPLVEGCLRAGSESAKVDVILKMLSRFYEMKVQMFNSIVISLIQPALAFVIILLFVLFNFLYVAPQMGSVLKTMGHPATGILKWQLEVGDIIKSYWYIFLAMFSGFLYFCFSKSKLRTRFFEWIFLRVPALGTVVFGLRQTAFAYCMSALSEAGMPYGKCFTYLVEVVKDTPMEEQIRQAARYHEECGSFSTSLERYVRLDPEIIFQIKVGEKTATVPEQLQRVALVYERSTAKSAEALASKITPIVIVVGAGMAVGSYLLPFFSLMSICYKMMRGGG
jgi:type II secretory pathway component PulF